MKVSFVFEEDEEVLVGPGEIEAASQGYSSCSSS